ncbi:hypothetical protein Peur_028843 [Populus x canadensis]
MLVDRYETIDIDYTTVICAFELWLMNEHGVKESRIKMLVMESNKIDPEKPQSSAGCNEIDIDGSSSGNPGCEVDSL